MSINDRLRNLALSPVDIFRRDFPSSDRRSRVALLTNATGASRALVNLIFDTSPSDATADQLLHAVRQKLESNLLEEGGAAAADVDFQTSSSDSATVDAPQGVEPSSDPLAAHLQPLPPDTDFDSPCDSKSVSVSFTEVDVSRPPPPPPYSVVVGPGHLSIVTPSSSLPSAPGIQNGAPAPLHRSTSASSPPDGADFSTPISASGGHLPSRLNSASGAATTGAPPADTPSFPFLPARSGGTAISAPITISGASNGAATSTSASASASVGAPPSASGYAAPCSAHPWGSSAVPSSSSPSFASGAIPRRTLSRPTSTLPSTDHRTPSSQAPPIRSPVVPPSPDHHIIPSNVDLSDPSVRSAVDSVLRNVLNVTGGRRDVTSRSDGGAISDRPDRSERFRLNWPDYNPARHPTLKSFFDEMDDLFEMTDFNPTQKILQVKSRLSLDHSNFATAIIKLRPQLKTDYNMFKTEMVQKTDGVHPRKDLEAFVALKQKADVSVVAYATEVRTSFAQAYPLYPPDQVDRMLSNKFIETLHFRDIAEKLSDHQFDLFDQFDQLVLHAQNYEINLLRKKKQGSFYNSGEISQGLTAPSNPPGPLVLQGPSGPSESFRFDNVRGLTLDEGIDRIISTLSQIRPFSKSSPSPRNFPAVPTRGRPYGRPSPNNTRGAPRGAWRPQLPTPQGRVGVNSGFTPPGRGSSRGRGRGRGTGWGRGRGPARGNPGARGAPRGVSGPYNRGRGAPGAPSNTNGPPAPPNPNNARPIATARRRGNLDPAPAVDSRKRLVDYTSSEGGHKIARQNYDGIDYTSPLWEGYMSNEPYVPNPDYDFDAYYDPDGAYDFGDEFPDDEFDAISNRMWNRTIQYADEDYFDDDWRQGYEGEDEGIDDTDPSDQAAENA